MGVVLSVLWGGVFQGGQMTFSDSGLSVNMAEWQYKWVIIAYGYQCVRQRWVHDEDPDCNSKGAN